MIMIYLALAKLLSFGHVVVEGIGFSASIMTWVFYALFSAIGAIILGFLVGILDGPKTAVSRIILSPIGQIALRALAFMTSSLVIEGFWISSWITALVLGILPGLAVSIASSRATKVANLMDADWNSHSALLSTPFPDIEKFFDSGWSDDGNSSYEHSSISEGGVVRYSRTLFRRKNPDDGRESGCEIIHDNGTTTVRGFGDGFEECYPQGLEGEKYGPDYFRRYR